MGILGKGVGEGRRGGTGSDYRAGGARADHLETAGIKKASVKDDFRDYIPKGGEGRGTTGAREGGLARPKSN